MMRTCDLCENWAQWVLTYPDKTKKYFCTTDKDKEFDALPDNERPKVRFAGAIPSGY